MRRQSFPESHEATCRGMARAMTIASQSATNSRRRRNAFQELHETAGDLERTASPGVHKDQTISAASSLRAPSSTDERGR